MAAKALAKSVQKGEAPSLTIAVGATVNLDLLMGHLRELFRAFPGIQYKMHRGSGAEISQMLKNGEIDLAVGGPLRETWDRLDAWPMFTEAFDLVVGADHPLAMLNDMDLDVELVRDSQVLLQSGGEPSDEVVRRLSAAGLPVGGAHEVATEDELEVLILADFGIAVAPASGLASHKLRHLPYDALDLRRTVAIYTVAGRQRSREAAALLNLLRSADWTPSLSLDRPT
jgi:DNA-binding transcriptional LysR family regulator